MVVRINLQKLVEVLKQFKWPPEQHTHVRDDITDFWNEPFWPNIPDKPFEAGIVTTDANGVAQYNFSKAVSTKPIVIAIPEGDGIVVAITQWIQDASGNYTGVQLTARKLTPTPTLNKTTDSFVNGITSPSGIDTGYYEDANGYIRHKHNINYTTANALTDVSLTLTNDPATNINIHILVFYR